MNVLPEFTHTTVALTGGLVATSAAVIAQSISTDTTVGASSFLLGGAGLIAAISAFTKDFWIDRQRQREHEIVKLRLKLRISRNTRALQELYDWAKSAQIAVSALPAVPELVIQEDCEPEVEKTSA